jgi:hypothetical protein
MSANKAYKHNLNVVLDLDDQPVAIASDVEHNPIVPENIGCAMAGFDVARCSPPGMFDFERPCFQLLFAVDVFRPEFDEFFPRNQAHFLLYPFLGYIQGNRFPFWEVP